VAADLGNGEDERENEEDVREVGAAHTAFVARGPRPALTTPI
jgi:hypothetical protein